MEKAFKTNKKFMLLSFFGIIMVVSGHCLNGGNPIRLFDNFFPINSFFMPMFIFISGYFFKEKYLSETKKFFKKKSINLVVYYFVWNIIYGLIRKILYKFNLLSVDIKLSFYNIIIAPFINRTTI